MADLMQNQRLDAYAQDLLNQSYNANPISPEILNYFGRGMQMQPAPSAPNIAAYSSQPIEQQAPALQPNQKRMEYMNLVEQRFNEIANALGGVNALVATGRIDKARKRAEEDVAILYGPAPSLPQPLQVQPIPGTNRVAVSGGGFSSPQMIEVQQPQQAMQLAPVISPEGQQIPGMGMTPSGEIKTYEPATKAAETRAKAAADNIGLASDVLSSVDSLLTDENALQWAGGMTGAVLGRIPGQTSGIRQKIEQLRDQIGLFGRKAIVGQGQGSISDAEQKMAKEAMAQIVTEGTDEQLINSLKAVRQKFGGILDRLQSESSGTQPQKQQAPSQVQTRTYIPGKGFK